MPKWIITPSGLPIFFYFLLEALVNFLAIKHDLLSGCGAEQSDRMQTFGSAGTPTSEFDALVVITV